MKILTFDTGTNIMNVAISEKDMVLCSKIVESTESKYNSALLIPTIIELLKAQKLTMYDIKAVGVNIGPASFTGIRAGVTVARVIAQNLNIPAVGIHFTEIISLLNATEKCSLCTMDARRGKAYYAIYSPDGNIIKYPDITDYKDILEISETNNYFIAADGKISEMLKKINITHININNFNFGENIVKLTWKYLQKQSDEQLKWYNLTPLYIQTPPIS